MTPQPSRVLLIGAGQFGTSLIAQAGFVPGLEIGVVCDREVEQVVTSLASTGLAAPRVCSDREAALAALENGRVVLVGDADLALDLPFDVLVEATGASDMAAAHAVRAINGGRHVIMVSKEAEITVGPGLARRAEAKGVVYTPVDGDQPSLLIQLVHWARGLGLEVVAAGKSSEYDLVLAADGESVTIQDRRVAAPGMGGLMTLEAAQPLATVERRAAAVDAFARRSAPDFCEMGIVCNGIEVMPDRPDLHAPILRPGELADVFKPVADGGVLERPGSIDIFHALRREDEASFAGGVFVVVRCRHRPTWELLREKGHVVSRCGRYAALYRPAHLLGVEAIGSVLRAVRERRPTPGFAPRPAVDLVARAARDLPRGTALESSPRHGIMGVVPELRPAGPVAGPAPVPFYMLLGRTLDRDVETGTTIRLDDLAAAGDDVLWRMRAEQDAAFFT
jgi:predicted homoserine dehydrogenase-like protein